jgi:hypothetical protein
MKFPRRLVSLLALTTLAGCAVQTGAPEDAARTGEALASAQPSQSGGAHAATDAKSPESKTPEGLILNPPRIPFCQHFVKDQSNGPTLSNPIVVNLFMGSYWMSTQGKADMAAVNSVWQQIVGQSQIYQPITEYISPGVGTFGGTDWVGFGADPGQQVQESLIQSFIDFELFENRAPYPQSGRTIYFVYVGNGAYSQYDTTYGFNGHHKWYSSKQAGQTVHYAVIDYESQLSAFTQIAYHELMEAMTDPEGNAFYDSSLGEGEIGDFCEINAPYGAYNLQQIWSQNACACISPPAPPIYFPIPIHLL